MPRPARSRDQTGRNPSPGSGQFSVSERAPTPPAHPRPVVSLDVFVILATVVWGANYAVVKVALRQIPEFAFNALRLSVASLLFLGVLTFYRGPGGSSPEPARAGRPRRLFPTARAIRSRDWLLLAALAVVGQFLYQLCFLGGVARTSVANSALIQGCSPVVITLLAAALGHERVQARQWAGAGMSLAGVYLLVGAGAAPTGSSLTGDLLMLGGVLCWSVYVVGSRPLLGRYSALAVSGYSMTIGTALYVAISLPELRRLDWFAPSPAAWGALLYSAVFSLFLAYVVWYTSIQRIGNVRTATYSNLIPVVALVTAVAFLGDRPGAREIAGAAVILVGVALARVAASPTPPPEE